MSTVVEEDRSASVPAADEAGVVVGVLGAVSVRRAGALIPVPGRRPRTVLAALAVEPGRYRSAAALIEDVWGGALPRDPMNALHTQLSRLRALLPDGALEQGPAGYRLALARGAVDLSRAQDGAAEAARQVRAGDGAQALETVRGALALVRGIAGDDLPDGPVRDDLRQESARLRRELQGVQIDGALALGREADALPMLQEICERNPLDEPSHAKLMRALAAVGRGNEAVALYSAVRARLADRLGTDPSDELAAVHLAILRGELGRPRHDGDEPDGSDTAAAPPPGSAVGLRAEPNALIGRDADVAALLDLLGSARAVTILGPGGTGKTRLAHHLGLRLSRDRRTALVELVGVRSGEDVDAAVAGALGLGETELRADRLMTDATGLGGAGAAAGRAAGGARAARPDARERLRGALAATPALLILDNCEQVVDACADLVADLVAACPELTVLATSRTPLMIAAESTYPLAPLPVAGDGSPATELFTQRARAARPSVRLEPDSVARLCTALDGLPLAIELAAARARSMSVEQIIDRLSDRFALLQSGDRSAPRRHRTLHAVIEWSWNLLGPHEQSALRGLACLPGGFTMDAARAIADEPAVPGAREDHGGGGRRGADHGDGSAGDARGDGAVVEAAVAGLVDQSLLEVTEAADPVGLRYHMLETVREFGLQQLAADPGLREQVEYGFRRWAGRWAARLAHGFVRDAADAMLRIEAEQENLVVVLRAALDRAELAVAVPVMTVLGAFWSIRGAHSEVAVWAQRVLAVITEAEDASAASGGDRYAWADQEGLDGDTCNMALLMITGYQMFVGDQRAMARSRVRMRRLHRSRPARIAEVRFLVRLAGITSPQQLGRLLSEGVRAADPGVRGLAHALRANAHENAGRRIAAQRDASLALDLARQRGDRWREGMAAQTLGQLSGQSGRYEDAVDYYRLAAQVLWDVHAYEESIQMRGFIAAALVGSGNPEAGRREALAARGAGDSMTAGAGDPWPTSQYRAAIAAALAEADLAEGATDSGLRLYREGVQDSLGVHGTETAAAVDPYTALLVSAATCAHADGASPDRAREYARLLSRTVVPRLRAGLDGTRESFVDLPITGAVLVALVAVDLATGRSSDDPRTLARELALAVRARARQDYPSMRLHRWNSAARLVLGDEAVDDELDRARSMPRAKVMAGLDAALRRRRPALADADRPGPA